MSLANRRTDRFACLEQFFILDSMSLGLVVLEKKLFTRTRTPTPQSDDIMSADKSADIKINIFATLLS